MHYDRLNGRISRIDRPAFSAARVLHSRYRHPTFFKSSYGPGTRVPGWSLCCVCADQGSWSRFRRLSRSSICTFDACTYTNLPNSQLLWPIRSPVATGLMPKMVAECTSLTGTVCRDAHSGRRGEIMRGVVALHYLAFKNQLPASLTSFHLQTFKTGPSRICQDGGYDVERSIEEGHHLLVVFVTSYQKRSARSC